MSKLHQAISDVQQRVAQYPLFPEVAEPNCHGMLPVSEKHTLYWEQCGVRNGEHHVVILHGGPGAGCNTTTMRRFHDPSHYTITLFDQRGCGRSTPHACTEQNTMENILEDMEKLREHLKIERWSLFGGSFGVTIALLYAQKFPHRVESMVLRGICLMRPSEVFGFYEDSTTAKIFPEAFDYYQSFIPPEERSKLLEAYKKRLEDESNPELQLEAAKRFAGWEVACCSSVPFDYGKDVRAEEEDEARSESLKTLAIARIENHFFTNWEKWGFSENHILDNISKMSSIPPEKIFLIQGRMDFVTVMKNAFDLKNSVPHCNLLVAPLGGHTSSDPDISALLIQATEALKIL